MADYIETKRLNPAGLASIYRTNTCGDLTIDAVGKTVRLSGWIARKRDHGGVLFVDLRDHYGVTQLVVTGDLVDNFNKIRVESVVKINGVVTRRAPGADNPNLKTGEIEVRVDDYEVLCESQVLPFPLDEDNVGEHVRLCYRFLDLRRERLQRNILLRSATIRALRDIMFELGFNEFQTPILTSSSPEGARDFLVPSRHYPGRFFALPQAPQQFKQLLMVAGFDRYFQIAPCFRDEDPRADRSPGEFYQLDVEMSFVTQEEVFPVAEAALVKVFKALGDKPVAEPPFPRIPYRSALVSYGTDKPDLRVPYQMVDVTSLFATTEVGVIQQALAQGGVVRLLPIPVDALPSRKTIDDAIALYTELTGLGLGYLVLDGDGVRGSMAKLLSKDLVAELSRSALLADDGSPRVLFVAAGPAKQVAPALGKVRVHLGEVLGTKSDRFEFCWITEMPMFELDEETGKIEFGHNPFSYPMGGLPALETQDPLDIVACQYDIVCNGYEITSGAIRNYSAEIMYRVFGIVGYGPEEVERRFGGMLRAFSYGSPPHGGFAAGIDRLVMLLAGEETIREVIPFPLAQSVQDLLMGAPSEITEKQWREIHLQLRPGVRGLE